MITNTVRLTVNQKNNYVNCAADCKQYLLPSSNQAVLLIVKTLLNQIFTNLQGQNFSI